ncbi:MAG TPA: 30S ribosomal protein S6 [Candidatus Paceibacterota bacterium]|jgi:small subunit ribosomal protein S6|nr:30S ribosomal protein S6 [Candidatus Paceibacterota bacterium]HRZ29316.1 30S ribosomal protein S6 [Candidatus Paceibacterota bacterium]
MKTIKYDLTLIIKGDKNLEEAQKIFDNIKTKLEKLGFIIEKTINPVLKELAFEINKFKQGYFGTFIFSIDNYDRKQVEELFKFDENVLRFLTVIYNDVTAKPKMRLSHKRQSEVKSKDEAIELAVNEVISPTQEVVQEEKNVQENIEEKKSIDLEHLDEKLDELLK